MKKSFKIVGTIIWPIAPSNTVLHTYVYIQMHTHPYNNTSKSTTTSTYVYTLTVGHSFEFCPVSINPAHLHLHQWGAESSALPHQVPCSNHLQQDRQRERGREEGHTFTRMGSGLSRRHFHKRTLSSSLVCGEVLGKGTTLEHSVETLPSLMSTQH